MPMKPEIKALWTEALRSGEYHQATGCLKELDADGQAVGYCCLGVLAELAVKDQPERFRWDGRQDNGAIFVDMETDHNSSGYLIQGIRDWAGLDASNPAVKYDKPLSPPVQKCSDRTCDICPQPHEIPLANLNDRKTPFAEIADLIDAQF